MTAELGGGELAAGIRAEVAAAAAELTAAGTPPRLAVVVATADESSAWYVRSIARVAERTGVDCTVVDLGETATPDRIRAELAAVAGTVDDLVVRAEKVTASVRDGLVR